jgi:hypothetical protein
MPAYSFRKKDAPAKKHPKVEYPADHKLGMRVTRGGSMCQNCEYLGSDKKSCTNLSFRDWNGSKILPAPADSYCCDMWQPAK